MRKTPLVLAAALAALTAGCYKDFDFTSDSKADYAVIDTNGTWRDLATLTVLAAGSYGDIPVPGDWDGNHLWDKAVVQANGDWVTGSPLGTINYPAPANLPSVLGHPWLSVRPVPADYDGDGDIEPAWYREVDATWFIQGNAPVTFGIGPSNLTSSSTAITANDYDYPVPADYDGDLKADISVFNPWTGSWRVRQSSNNAVTTVSMTGNGSMALAAPADYDKVGHAQRAVFGPNGWIIEGHATPELFGAASQGETGLPAPADYDGDGALDLSYVGTTTGIWYTEGASPNITVAPDEAAVVTNANLIANKERFAQLGACFDNPDVCVPSEG